MRQFHRQLALLACGLLSACAQPRAALLPQPLAAPALHCSLAIVQSTPIPSINRVELRIQLENRSDQKVVFEGLAPLKTFNISIHDASNTAVPLTPFGRQYLSAVPISSNIVTLKPHGDKYLSTTLLADFFQLDKPGTYTVSIHGPPQQLSGPPVMLDSSEVDFTLPNHPQ